MRSRLRLTVFASRLLVALVFFVATSASAVTWRRALSQPADWYETQEAAEMADAVIKYQSGEGGWPKNIDFSSPPTDAYRALRDVDRAATIDNGGTTTPLRFLARVINAQHRPNHIAAASRGIEFLLDAQLPSGGWPQFFPLRDGYYSHITYNDNAMVNVMTLLRDVAAGRGTTFDFVDDERVQRARLAVDKGVECMLRTQVRQNGVPTGWCAQHHPETLAPAWARNFEPPSLSGNETVGIVRFLMNIDSPPPRVREAIEGAVAWLAAVRISGLSVEDFTGEDGQRDRRAVRNEQAHPLWARFYELGTNRPIFLGRDKVVRYDFNEIERERRINYAYLGTWPAKLLREEYPRWRDAQGSQTQAALVPKR